MREKIFKKKIIVGFVLLFIIIAVPVIVWYLRKDALVDLLTEKVITDTTEEKAINISETFQVYKNRLYCNSEKGFGFIDLETGKRENLTTEYISDFVICDDIIYYMDMIKVLDCVVCKNLNDVAKKERLRALKDIESYIFVNKEVIALRERDDKHVIIKWGEDGSEQVLLEFGVDVIESFEAQLCGYYEGKYIFFSKGGGIYTVDESTGQVRNVFSVEKEGSVFCVFMGARCTKDKVYIWGIAHDSSKSALCGPYYVEDSEKTGVWQVDLNNYEAKRVSDGLFHDEVSIVQGELYEMEDDVIFHDFFINESMFQRKKMVLLTSK